MAVATSATGPLTRGLATRLPLHALIQLAPESLHDTIGDLAARLLLERPPRPALYWLSPDLGKQLGVKQLTAVTPR
jgi:hypothetical protein